MKFSTRALHQLVIFGAVYTRLVSGNESGGTSSSLRRRELEASSCNSTSITWKPTMSLKVTDDNGYACGLSNGKCDFASPSCSPSFSAMLVRPDGYNQHVVHQVCFDENCIFDFSLATASSNSECLTIPNGHGKYRGLKLSGISPTIEAEVFADGEVICSGEAQPSCRTDYSWLPGMTLEVSTEDGKCGSVAGCSIDATLSDTGVCSIYPGSLVMARPAGYPDHTVNEVYSTGWSAPVTSFHAAIAGASNNEDCLVSGGIKLSSKSDKVIQAVVSEDGSVYCRSLVLGGSCDSNEQCLEGSCETQKCLLPHGETCTSSGECASGSCEAEKCVVQYGGECTSNDDCASSFCNENAPDFWRCDKYEEGAQGSMCTTDVDCDRRVCNNKAIGGFALCDIFQVGQEGAMCRTDADCDSPGLECVGVDGDASPMDYTCIVPLGGYQDECSVGADCESGICNELAPDGPRCDNVAVGDFGAMCSDFFHCNSACCSGGVCQQNNVCAAPREYQASCSTNSDCNSNICNANAPGAGSLCDSQHAGGPEAMCTDTDDCDVDLSCLSGKCFWLAHDYEECQGDSFCLSGHCNPNSFAPELGALCDPHAPGESHAMCRENEHCNSGCCDHMHCMIDMHSCEASQAPSQY